jgi:copper ion binding protein
MVAQVFTVKGMSCEHCVRAVTAEIAGLPGVRRVDVDLSAEAVSVESDRELSDSEVGGAVEAAGYELAPHAREPLR